VDRITSIQYAIASFLLWSLAHSPLSLARLYANLLDLALPRLRRVAMRNLELAYPEKTVEERKAIVDEVFRSIARLL
jgi:lauroyl/myristoyl acyltransferase